MSTSTPTVTVNDLRERLQEISATASIAAQALDGGLDYLPGELPRLLMGLDAAHDRLQDVCERLAAGVDPQGATEGPSADTESGPCSSFPAGR
jgi:hypothetical protein